ncbi:hypothetical protein KBC85_01885 [Candidatus Saccharibacteria bacterium]|nr:hypothetical protein [Candidatus Saccharibacteria bacterium]MDQ5885596.1 hypothetical protein [Patescibacteria group bacterium]MDQ5958716.1 hypothetical protein [Patescibacteria group bacterium]
MSEVGENGSGRRGLTPEDMGVIKEINPETAEALVRCMGRDAVADSSLRQQANNSVGFVRMDDGTVIFKPALNR